MKRAALYLRVSSFDQNPQTQVHDLRFLAAQRNLEIVKEMSITASAAPAPAVPVWMN